MDLLSPGFNISGCYFEVHAGGSAKIFPAYTHSYREAEQHTPHSIHSIVNLEGFYSATASHKGLQIHTGFLCASPFWGALHTTCANLILLGAQRVLNQPVCAADVGQAQLTELYHNHVHFRETQANET